jgi:hypothetical protein
LTLESASRASTKGKLPDEEMRGGLSLQRRGDIRAYGRYLWLRPNEEACVHSCRMPRHLRRHAEGKRQATQQRWRGVLTCNSKLRTGRLE